MGYRSRNLTRCLNHLKSIGTIKNTSFLYESAPMYYTKQQPFLNAAVHLESTYDPVSLLHKIKYIEQHQMKRQSNFRNGPRIIDIDLLCAFHNSKEIHLTHHEDPYPLTIPHSRLVERNFVVTPLSDLIPNYQPKSSSHTVHSKQKTVSELSHHLSANDESQNLFQILPLNNTNLHRIDSSDGLLQHKTLLMAILNITPDSFSDGGTWIHQTDRILKYIEHHLQIGTQIDILDIGGQSTRPQSDRLSVNEEVERVVPVLDAIHRHFRFNENEAFNIPISIDTYHSEVARQCVMNHGVDIINDISGGTMDEDMYCVAADLGVPYICMHLRGDPSNMQSPQNLKYGENNEMEQFIYILTQELHDRVRAAESCGVAKWNIVVDPGIGFAKTSEQNQYLLSNLWKVRNEGKYPILSGCSRKSFFNGILGEDIARKGADSEEKIIGTQVGVTASIVSGADIVRVHDLYTMDMVRRVSDSLKNVNESRSVPRTESMGSADAIYVEMEEGTSWDELEPFTRDNVLNEDGLKLLSRTDEMWERYDMQREEQMKKYVDYSDFIRAEFLGFDVKKVMMDYGEFRLISVPKHEGYRCVRFTINDFPLHLKSDIDHYCLWSTHKMTKSEIEKQITREFPDTKYIWWENANDRKTVPEVWHIQVLILKKSSKVLWK